MPSGAESELWERVLSEVSGAAGERAFVAFSGGVDSSLVAMACRAARREPTLLTVGFEGSRDVRFARHIAAMIGAEQHTRIIDGDGVACAEARVDAVAGGCALSWRENCIAMFHIAELAASLGAKRVLTANGIDELFCGYDAYRRVAGDPDAVDRMMREKIDNETAMMRAVDSVASVHGVRMVQPLLSPGFVEYAARVPLADKIAGPGDLLRKHIVRRLAESVGVPRESAYSRKKALQYGSGIHRALVRQ